MSARMRDKRDRQKKTFIETLEAQGTVSHAAKNAGVSRWPAYRWRQVIPNSLINGMKHVRMPLTRLKLAGEVIPAIFYLKAHRPPLSRGPY